MMAPFVLSLRSQASLSLPLQLNILKKSLFLLTNLFVFFLSLQKYFINKIWTLVQFSSKAGVLLGIMLRDISDSFILSSFLRLVIFYISGDSGRNLEKTEF